MSARDLEGIAAEVVVCRACPRLVEWRERVARDKTARFADQTYWGRPVPGFGDPAARILIVGLAPAAHGGNRTGRIFTGDRSGDFLYASLHRVGLSNQPTSVSQGRRVAAHRRVRGRREPMRAAEQQADTPGTRRLPPLPRARDRRAASGSRWSSRSGRSPGTGVLRAFRARGHTVKPRPVFGHANEVTVGPYALLGCFHPSQQNTFTGTLTPQMLDGVFERAVALAG